VRRIPAGEDRGKIVGESAPRSRSGGGWNPPRWSFVRQAARDILATGAARQGGAGGITLARRGSGGTRMMKTYVALFRGINVAGNNILPMRDLTRLLEGLGLENVRTYIQSGNVVFQSAGKAGEELAGKIRSAIGKKHGFSPHLVLLTHQELAKAAKANPYPEAESDPRRLHLTFLASSPRKPDLASLEALRANGERFALKGKVLYLHAPEGIGRSKLAARMEKALGVPGTTRNWRTVAALREMAGRSQ
jgi:uncharacterized protein (DUF1697 family)